MYSARRSELSAHFLAGVSIFRQKQRGEVVQKPPAQIGGSDLMKVPRYQPFMLGGAQRAFDDGERQAGMLREQRDGKALVETQCIQHEFDAGFAPLEYAFGRDTRGGRGLVEILARMTQFGSADDALMLGIADLGVGAGAYAEIIAEQPVVEIVAAAMAGARVGSYFILHEAGSGEPCLTTLLHFPQRVVVRQVRRSMGEAGIGFDGELLM